MVVLRDEPDVDLKPQISIKFRYTAAGSAPIIMKH